MVAGLQLQAQGCRRRFPQRLLRPEQESQLGVGLSSELQAPQAGKFNALGPGQHGAAAAATQRLLTGPQRFLCVLGTHQEQAPEPQVMGL